MNDDVDEARCPRCGTPGIEIVYGLPGPDLAAEAERGEVIIGGCLVDETNPTHQCPACDTTWGGEPWPDDD